MEQSTHRVRRVRRLSGGCSVLEIDGPVPETRAGQFYMVRTADRWPVLLPRPFSLYDRCADGSWGSFLLKAVGPGTRALDELEQGEQVIITGRLGQPFPEQVEDPVCIAGGIGLAPFLLLARRQLELGRKPPRLLFGGRSEDLLAGKDDFAGMARLHCATDDGSFGFPGLVTELLEDLLAKGEVATEETVFCCGPNPMMEAVARLCRERGIECYVSLETYMGCGYGVCNGCSVAVHGKRFGGWPYSKTCTEGPVYRADELVGFGCETVGTAGR